MCFLEGNKEGVIHFSLLIRFLQVVLALVIRILGIGILGLGHYEQGWFENGKVDF